MPKVKLLASLQEIVGKDVLELEDMSLEKLFRELAERYPGLRDIIDVENVEGKPGYIIFVDGKDIRLVDKNYVPKEIVILPVNHGGKSERIEIEQISWEKIDLYTRKIAEKIRNSGYQPDVIVGILRGGLVPARLLADELGVDDIGVMEIKLYKTIGLRGERPYLRQPLVLDITEKKVLLVDDISDTGLTLQLAMEAVGFHMPKEVKTVTLYIKPWTNLVPDYYAEVTENWIVFPWERNEYRRLIEEE
ncbi:MAG: hypothetical protein GSR81_05955 [Desulfurococcales archaeon]|nr:hypothetical protein [Desulfurococcales archaeon]